MIQISWKTGLVLLFICFSGSPIAHTDSSLLISETAALAKEITENGKAYTDLVELTQMGPRLSGSTGADQAVTWAQAKMKNYGFDKVWTQPVTVPRWVRGTKEKATLTVDGSTLNLKVTALGNSVGTSHDGNAGIDAPVVEVKSLKEVDALGSTLKGKIVFYNRAMDASVADTFEAYSGASDQRSQGPARAAKYGAVAALVRSLTTLTDDYPHTGVTSYGNGKKIPAAALSTIAANELSKQLKKNPHLKLHLELSAERLAPVTSFNVIGEIRGSLYPNQIVLVGGHLDSWDLGTGAHDDGAGVVQSLEILRSIRALGLKPKRTIRAVMFMSEEFGGIGADEYAKQAGNSQETHLAAMESDRGGFAPRGFSVSNNLKALQKIKSWSQYLAPLHASEIQEGYSGVDVEPLSSLGVTAIGYIPESQHYFDFHHCARDRIEAVDKKELHASAAAMGVLTYLISELGL